MRCLPLWLTLLSLIVASTFCWAQPTKPATPAKTQPPAAKQRLKQGEPAPFAGILLNDTAEALLVLNTEAKLKSLQLEVDRLKKELALEQLKSEDVCRARITGEQMKYAACSADADRCRTSLEKLGSPPWYQSSYVQLLLGTAVGGGICAAATRIK